MPDPHDHPLVDRRRYPAETEYTRLLEAYIAEDLRFNENLKKELATLKKELDELTVDTKGLVDSYELAQKLTKGLVVVGQLLKYVGSMILLYYSITQLMETLHKTS